MFEKKGKEGLTPPWLRHGSVTNNINQYGMEGYSFSNDFINFPVGINIK